MNNPENPQATIAAPKPSVVFKAWKKLLAKRKNNFSIRVLCIVLITIATLISWVIRLFLEFMANLPEAVSEGLKNTESTAPHGDDPWSDFSMSLNGYD